MIKLFGPEILGAFIAVVLQAYIAPYTEIGYAIPNFCLVYAVSYTVASRRTNVMFMPFLLGLAADFLGQGPVGAYAFVTLCACFIASRVVALFGNGTPTVPVLSIALVLFGANVLYAAIYIACGWNVAFGEAFVLRCLPVGLYDTVIALILYPFLRFALRFTAEDDVVLTSLV